MMNNEVESRRDDISVTKYKMKIKSRRDEIVVTVFPSPDIASLQDSFMRVRSWLPIFRLYETSVDRSYGGYQYFVSTRLRLIDRTVVTNISSLRDFG